MTTIDLNIGQDFSNEPRGRYKSESPDSAERFREELLIPYLRGYDTVRITLDDGVEGYGANFLEEAFVGILRQELYTFGELRSKLQFCYRDKDYAFYESIIWDKLSKFEYGKANDVMLVPKRKDDKIILDNKYSISVNPKGGYDIYRYGEFHSTSLCNVIGAMYYKILEIEGRL